jgi:hypothetical protein
MGAGLFAGFIAYRDKKLSVFVRFIAPLLLVRKRSFWQFIALTLTDALVMSLVF